MLRPYQEEAIEKVEEAWEDGIRDPSVDIFCGLGKSVILLELIVRFDGLMAIVMPSLSLVQQFCGKYLAPHRHLAFCTLGESTEGVAIGTTDPAEAAAFSSDPGIFVVTYKSLAKLLEHVPDIERLLFDEAHHVAEEANAYIKGMDAEVAYFSATPDKDVGTEVFRFSYFDSLMNDPQYSQDFRIQCGMFTGEQGDSLLELIERTAEKTGNKRILTFHSKVNGDSPTSVRTFARVAAAHFGDRATVAYMDADTPMGERVRLLERLDSTPDDQIFLLASCETIGEGVDTKRCNHIVFVDPVKSYVKIVQKLGRCVRRQQNDNPSTVLIPIFLERAKYEACTTAEERDAMVRSDYSERGDFNPVFNFICAVRESDPDLLDLILSSKCIPAARLEHYRKIVGDSPRLTFEEAVEKLTGERTTNIQDAALRTNKTIEVHDRDGNVTQYGGEAAAVDSIVEMEPDAYVAVHGGVPTPPREKRIVFVESPFLLSINLEKEVIDYEVRPSVFQEHVDQVTAFVAEHGRLPKIAEDNGNWISKQRQAYRKGKLSPERIRDLEAIPLWTWEPFEESFETAVAEVISFGAEHGRLPKIGEENGGWIRNQRQLYKKNKLSTERVQVLEAIPLWKWEAFNVNKVIAEVTTFVVEHGRLPKKREQNGVFIIRSRQQYKKNTLTAEQIQLLEAIPMWKWEYDEHEQLIELFVLEIKAFVAQHGRLPTESEDNGRWIMKQRTKYRMNELSTERIQTLEAIPLWTWDPLKDVFETAVTRIKAFVTEHGRLPTQGEDSWISNQREAFKKGKLSTDRIHVIESIPLWTWNKREDSFKISVSWVKAFVAEHGRLPTTREDLGLRFHKQRQLYKKGKLSAERIQLIETIPLWEWDPLEDAFETNVTEVTAFVAEHGRLPKSGEQNGGWIIKQRQAYKKKKLSAERAQVLQAIPLWTWGFEDAFEKAVAEVTAFVSEHGRLPKKSENNGPWISHQRQAYKKKKLTSERIRDLEAIPLWTWVGASTKSATSEESDESDMQDEARATPDRPEPTEEASRPRATPEEHRRRILETMTPEEMADQLARGRTRGYTAPNPKDKDEINALFARSLPDEGLVVFLDHTDFKTARAVGDREMLIPQRDRAAFDEMHADPTYGRYVKFGDFTQLVRGIKRPIGGIYADFTGPLKTGLEFVEACKEVEFAPKAVVGVTIAMRNPEGNDSYTNAAVEKLSTAMSDKLDVVSIDGPVEPMYYGTGMPMVTVMKKRRT